MSNLANQLYLYRITKVLTVHDGDTFRAIVDLGFRVYTKVTIRLLDIDALEIERTKKLKHQEERYHLTEEQVLKIAKKQKEELERLLNNATEVIVHFKAFDSFGRALGLVFVDGELINPKIKAIQTQLSK